ncbi:PAAR domain-containing protein [Paraburkholderia phymatum]|uniref:PAAR domain-containing protein n=1 Tax=Paraburkholderia phymatum TaxID=148447 RepID=A0ACC6U0Q3_9BURK
MERLVKAGDRTTTGGRVMSGTSSQYEEGEALCCDGDMATCGNCKGVYPIFGTARTWLDEGRSMVLDLDQVGCPCRKNRVLASGGMSMFYSKDRNVSVTPVSTPNPAAAPAYDEQFVLRDPATGEPLQGVAYRIVSRTGAVLASGVTDSKGATARVTTNGADALKFELSET